MTYRSNLKIDANKNLDIKTHVSYIHVDSSKRQKTSNIYGETYYLPPFAIHFTNGSSKVTVDYPNHILVPGDKITLSNVISKNAVLQNVLMVKKNSHYMRIFHQNHGLSLYGLFNPTNDNEFKRIKYVNTLPTFYNENDDIHDGIDGYYILRKNSRINFTIELSNIKGSDFSRNFIGNISTNFLNKKHIVYLLFTKNGNRYVHDRNSYLIKLEKKSSINYVDNINYIKDHSNNPTKILATNMVHVRFNTLYGIPLEYLNLGMDGYSKYLYASIIETTKNNFTIDVYYPAIVDPEIDYYDQPKMLSSDINESQFRRSGGGNQIYLKVVTHIIMGYPQPNIYDYHLGKNYYNVISARIIASEFPNSQKIIYRQLNGLGNNKLYWRNLDDGNYIYNISITPGNYTPLQLKDTIEKAFGKTIRYQYTKEYLSGIIPEIIDKTTPDNYSLYDKDGYYKYHIVKVSISDITDLVSFRFFRKLIRIDDGESHFAIKVPDVMIEFETATDIRSNFGTNSGTSEFLVPLSINPFDPDRGEILYIYFTPNCHIRIPSKFSYAYGNLYEYHASIDKNKFIAKLVTDRALLVNFHRIKQIYPIERSTIEIKSVNTSTLLQNFNFDYLTNVVELKNHRLKPGDLIITDQFIDPLHPNEIFVYNVDTVIGSNNFTVTKYNHGERYKFIYDGIIINFGSNQLGSQYWLDQVDKDELIVPISEQSKINNSLSFISIKPLNISNLLMWVNHPKHNLNIGDIIKISDSGPINQVPPHIINGKHYIDKIIDEDNYQINLNSYTPISSKNSTINVIAIQYPDKSQLFFNFKDTIGKILNFKNVGESMAITPYKHIIKNNDLYEGQYQINEQNMPIKLNMKGDNYFYICSRELATIKNTTSVNDVFAIIRWTEKPGKVVFDSFVPTINFFDPPLSRLSELHFEFRKPDGDLVDFNGMDHSFTIEIVELRK